MPTIRVVVVDDSAVARNMIATIVNGQPDMRCIGMASDAMAAREMIRELDPDVVTLDIEMPGMDGLAFLERLMRLRPTPVVMVSTLTEAGADATLRALELGAVDFVTKPQPGQAHGLAELARQLADKVRGAAQARIRRVPQASAAPALTNAPKAAVQGHSSRQLVCIGASTGGTEAVRDVLVPLPITVPPIVIAQHMPARFTTNFARRLDSLCALNVREARDGEPLLTGHAYIAPGGKHLAVRRLGAGYAAVVSDGEPVNRHKPSVDVLFRSVARVAGAQAIGIMLTGMGADGALAMRELRDQGAHNLVQDEASCVVFGMPREAIRAGAAHEVVPLARMAQALLARLSTHRAA